MIYVGSYKSVKKGIGLYGKVSIDITLLSSNENHVVIDSCLWKSIGKNLPNANIKPYIPWKKTALEGIKYALSIIKTKYKYKINLVDIDGHISHSNSSSIFAASIITVFTAFNIELNHKDYIKLTDFVFNNNNRKNIFILPSFYFLGLSPNYIAINENSL